MEERKKKKKKKNVISNFAAKNPLNVHHSEVKDIHREREKKIFAKVSVKTLSRQLKKRQ